MKIKKAKYDYKIIFLQFFFQNIEIKSNHSQVGAKKTPLLLSLLENYLQ